MNKIISVLLFFFMLNSVAAGAAENKTVKEPPPPKPSITSITFHGHSAFEIVTPKGEVLMIDPWLNNPANPNTADGTDPVALVKKLDYILVTHGHFDHIGDAVALSKKTKARLVTNFELGGNMQHLLGYPKLNMRFSNLMNIGGEISIADNEVIVAMTPALHSSGMENPNAKRGQSLYVYGGQPAGFVLIIQDGPTIYHAGDTAYFSDMKLIGEQYKPDVALLPIGGQFVMEPDMAAKAAEAVRAKLVIPMHYGTSPVLEQKPQNFTKAMKESGLPYHVLKPGGSVQFSGKEMQK